MQELTQAPASRLGAFLASDVGDGDGSDEYGAWDRRASFIVALLGACEAIAGAATAMDRQSAIDSHPPNDHGRRRRFGRVQYSCAHSPDKH